MREHVGDDFGPHVADQLAEQRRLGREVVLHRAGGHAGTVGDAPHRRTGVSVLDEAGDRRVQHRRLGRLAALRLCAALAFVRRGWDVRSIARCSTARVARRNNTYDQNVIGSSDAC